MLNRNLLGGSIWDRTLMKLKPLRWRDGQTLRNKGRRLARKAGRRSRRLWGSLPRYLGRLLAAPEEKSWASPEAERKDEARAERGRAREAVWGKARRTKHGRTKRNGGRLVGRRVRRGALQQGAGERSTCRSEGIGPPPREKPKGGRHGREERRSPRGQRRGIGTLLQIVIGSGGLLLGWRAVRVGEAHPPGPYTEGGAA